LAHLIDQSDDDNKQQHHGLLICCKKFEKNVNAADTMARIADPGAS